MASTNSTQSSSSFTDQIQETDDGQATPTQYSATIQDTECGQASEDNSSCPDDHSSSDLSGRDADKSMTLAQRDPFVCASVEGSQHIDESTPEQERPHDADTPSDMRVENMGLSSTNIRSSEPSPYGVEHMSLSSSSIRSSEPSGKADGVEDMRASSDASRDLAETSADTSNVTSTRLQPDGGQTRSTPDDTRQCSQNIAGSVWNNLHSDQNTPLYSARENTNVYLAPAYPAREIALSHPASDQMVPNDHMISGYPFRDQTVPDITDTNRVVPNTRNQLMLDYNETDQATIRDENAELSREDTVRNWCANDVSNRNWSIGQFSQEVAFESFGDDQARSAEDRPPSRSSVVGVIGSKPRHADSIAGTSPPETDQAFGFSSPFQDDGSDFLLEDDDIDNPMFMDNEDDKDVFDQDARNILRSINLPSEVLDVPILGRMNLPNDPLDAPILGSSSLPYDSLGAPTFGRMNLPNDPVDAPILGRMNLPNDPVDAPILGRMNLPNDPVDAPILVRMNLPNDPVDAPILGRMNLPNDPLDVPILGSSSLPHDPLDPSIIGGINLLNNHFDTTIEIVSDQMAAIWLTIRSRSSSETSSWTDDEDPTQDAELNSMDIAARNEIHEFTDTRYIIHMAAELSRLHDLAFINEHEEPIDLADEASIIWPIPEDPTMLLMDHGFHQTQRISCPLWHIHYLYYLTLYPEDGQAEHTLFYPDDDLQIVPNVDSLPSPAPQLDPSPAAQQDLNPAPIPRHAAQQDLNPALIPRHAAQQDLSPAPIPRHAAQQDLSPVPRHVAQQDLSPAPIPRHAAQLDLSPAPQYDHSPAPQLNLSPRYQLNLSSSPQSNISPSQQLNSPPHLNLSPPLHAHVHHAPQVNPSPPPQVNPDPQINPNPYANQLHIIIPDSPPQPSYPNPHNTLP